MAATKPRVESAYYERTADGYICDLCPHHCHIRYGEFGRCGSRRADYDMLVACSYGKVSSMCFDPVEKKPLYHYKPKSGCFSVGGVGCNMRCLHCQNYAISSLPSGKKRATYKSPGEIVGICRQNGFGAIAFTYNEPMIWFEYIRDVMALAPDLELILVTNGLVCREPLEELCGMASAMNIDVKGFTEDFYRKVCGARLGDVKETCEFVFSRGVHLELAYLVIPGYNDSETEIREFCAWVRDSLSPDVPVHFNRFHPDNLMTDVPWTPVETLERCRDTGLSEGLHYVYIGNAMTDDGGDTICPECGSVAVRRVGYSVDTGGLDGSRCAKCGRDLNIVRRGRTSGSPAPPRGEKTRPPAG